MFRLPEVNNLNEEEVLRYEKLLKEAPHCPGNSPDPYGSIGEAFLLFSEP